MLVRVPDYYQNFKCIAGDCTDTCCAGWEVDVDDASYEYYKTITGEFGERLKSVMIDGNSKCEGRFQIRPDGRCPFLNDKNLCDLYATLGEDALCVTCDQYPRYTTEYGNLREIGIALSCKTAAELILKKDETPGFTEFTNDDAPTLNNIDGELYLLINEARNNAYQIIWNRKYTIWERMATLLKYSSDIQKNIKTPKNIKNIKVKYISELKSVKPEERSKILKKWFKYYLKQHIIKPKWPETVFNVMEMLDDENYGKMLKDFSEYYYGKMYEFENIMTYFTFRYFMKSVFDRDLLSKVKMGIISTIIIYECDMLNWYINDRELNFADQVEITHMYSREVEHSEENFANLCKLFRKKKCFEIGNIEKLILHE